MKTRSEEIFEDFLTRNNLAFSKIEEDTSAPGQYRPDYSMHLGASELIFEIKELAEDEKLRWFTIRRGPTLNRFRVRRAAMSVG